MFKNPENPGSRNSLTLAAGEISQRLNVAERLLSLLKKDSAVSVPIF
jgi:hypothetical protein